MRKNLPLASSILRLAPAILMLPLAVQAHEWVTTLAPTVNVVVPQWHRVVHPHHHHPHHSHHPPRPPREAPVELAGVQADVRIVDRTATTTLTFTLRNPGSRMQESVVLCPVPATASLLSFDIDGDEGKIQAELMPRDEARRIYDDIVRRLIDPGLLEFAGTGVIKSSVFPVPPQGTAKARVVYQEFLPEDGGRIDYHLPRSEGPSGKVPWTVSLSWKLPGGVASLYCPSHPAEVCTGRDGSASLKLRGPLQPGAIQVAAVRGQKDRPALAVTAYPAENGEDGYFLLVVAPPPGHEAPTLKREVTLVYDRSGSMAGPKMDQVRAAALQVVEGLEVGEAFNIIAYNEAVRPLFDAPRLVGGATRRDARAFISGVRPSGGTNIHDALLQALDQPGGGGRLPVVLFLTDGLPTVGETVEKRLRDAIAQANRGGSRIFTFGVGTDVNTPLLAGIANRSRAMASFVLPGEDVEMKVVGLFNRLAGPVVADPRLAVRDRDGQAAGRVDDVLPAVMPDLFAGDARVVVGRYHGRKPLQLVVRGEGTDGEVVARVRLDPGKASHNHAHIPRLWATRRIAVLSEAVRDLGIEGTPSPDDPRVRELIEEITRLSLEHGVLSEYTAFLAREGRSFDARPAEMQAEVYGNYHRRALGPRSGAAAVNQEVNAAKAMSATVVDKSNGYLDEDLQAREVGGVQQVADRTFFRNGRGEWADSRLVGREEAAAEDVMVGSPAFDHLVDRLVEQSRQSLLALPGDILLVDEGRTFRIRRGE